MKRPKIFGIGMSRTATTTLTHVLNHAGYNIVHYPTMIQMYSMSNDGCTDIPVILEYKKLDGMFPNSKFVYTIREKEEWLDSIVPYLERKRSWTMKEQEKIRKMVYGSPFPTREEASLAWDKHREDVDDYFRDRLGRDLLILDIIGGDSPDILWDFLGIRDQKPPMKFPVKNKLKRNP